MKEAAEIDGLSLFIYFAKLHSFLPAFQAHALSALQSA